MSVSWSLSVTGRLRGLKGSQGRCRKSQEESARFHKVSGTSLGVLEGLRRVAVCVGLAGFQEVSGTF